MKVLVTGNNGYIGPIIVGRLNELGHETVGLDTMYYRGCGPADPALPSRQIVKDIRKVEPKDLDGIDAVMHLAALSNDPIGELNPALTADINFRASLNLAKLAKDAGVRRFIFSASCSMYGAGDEGWLTEESGFNPQSAYAHSKVDSEREISRLADDGFSPVFLRNATAYGLSPQHRVDLVVNNLVGWARTTGKIKIMSDGTPWRPVVHIEDIARAFTACLTAPGEAIHGHAFNVGRNEDNYQIKDIAFTVRKLVPGAEVELLNMNPSDTRTYRVDFSKIKQTLPDFTPRWNLERGIMQLYEAYRNMTLTLDDFEGRRFIRIKQLRYLKEKKKLDENLYWVKG